MADHLVDIVNKNDEIIWQDFKSKKVEKWFISRVVAILLRRSNWMFIVCKRANYKTNAAGLYDLSAFGNVMAWESYADAAKRELLEETNIDCPIKLLEKIYQEVQNDGAIFKIFCAVFVWITDETPKLNKELVEIKEMKLKEIEEEIALHAEDFCPWFINDFNQVKSLL